MKFCVEGPSPLTQVGCFIEHYLGFVFSSFFFFFC